MAAGNILNKSGSEAREQILDEMYRVHHDAVYRSGFKQTGNAEEAEDVVQIVFLKLAQRELTPETMRNPRAYLCRAAIHEAWKLYNSRDPEDAIDDFERFHLIAPEDAPLFDDDIVRDLRRAMAKLSPRAIEMLRLRYDHDLSLAEVAEAMETTESAVSVSLNRLRARLREELETMGGQA
jgi:RNA polymerase sigma-70 factor (ECF subfamily)